MNSDTTNNPTPSDAELLAWCLKYGHAKTLGVVTDFEYVPITLELIYRAIARERCESNQRADNAPLAKIPPTKPVEKIRGIRI